MESWIIENFTFQNVVLICIVGYWLFPKLKRWILREKQLDDNDTDTKKRLENLESDVKDLKSKVGRDYYTLQDIQKQTQDSLEEREILMRATLAILEGLQEIGANGPTKAAQAEIKDYLTRKAHQN